MKSIILFNNTNIMGKIPYKNYNCSIIKLNNNETNKYTNGNSNIESILITFYVSLPNKRYGTMNWVGILCYNNIMELLNNEIYDNNKCIWIIKPHLLQNDLGPKYADLRIFKMKHNIGAIGYTRLAQKSNTQGISDYYIRASILDIRNNYNLYVNPTYIYIILII